MADYQIGGLNIPIVGGETSAITQITATVKAINSLSRAMRNLVKTDAIHAGLKIQVMFDKIARAASSIDARNLDNLAKAAKSLSAISKVSKLGDADFEKMGAGFTKLSKDISPFLQQVQAAEKSLTALNGIVQKMGGKGGKGAKNNFLGGGGFLKAAGWTSVIYLGRRLGRVVSSIAKEGADYTETLNLWETAMSDNLDMATKFVDKMNEAYGISEKTLMQAQATFKNMLGSLGNITEEAAYALSEGVTQMAIDYASLYNQNFDKAFEKFQSALAGQVRPIRSVSGFDITENTIYQLYQQLGGTKTMRQLNRTEKQLLAIYAIFNQMAASGAVGDLDKTMKSYANQARVAAEAWSEVKQYSGVLLTDLIEQAGILTYANGILLFIGDTLKAAAEATGAIKHFGDPFAAVTEGAQVAQDATNELNGKLLDFDKIRAMQTPEESGLALDSKLIDALSQYDSILSGASMKAREIANSLGSLTGLFDEDGNFNPDKWETYKNALIGVGTALGVLVGYKALKIGAWIAGLGGSASLASVGFRLLNAALVGGTIFFVLQAVEAFKKGEYWSFALNIAISVLLLTISLLSNKTKIAIAVNIAKYFQVAASAALHYSKALISTIASYIRYTVAMRGLTATITRMSLSFIGLSAAVTGVVLLVQNWGDMSTWQKIIGIVGVATAAFFGLAVAIGAFQSAWSLGIAAAAIAAGIAAITVAVASAKKKASDYNVTDFAVGGLPQQGTLFRAGEAGTELVYDSATGQSGVANIKQLKAAFLQALIEYGNEYGDSGDERIVVKIGEDEAFNAVRRRANRAGLDFAKKG